MATRDYTGSGIIVHWDSERCFHSERCTMGLPAVFDRSARPWVNVDAAFADEVARVIDTCPSGALTYTRTDGAPNGRRGRAADDDPAASVALDPQWQSVSVSHRDDDTSIVTITPLRDGPLSVTGSVELTAPDGTTQVVARCELCRCGQSAAKPYCDGSHARVGFVAPGWDPAAP